MVADAKSIVADVAEDNVQCCKMQNDAYTESIGNTGDISVLIDWHQIRRNVFIW